ncbi:F-box only protein 30 [Amphibalanus amphitrite]|uniref:F-box only protein 30 n=1 Tax=Amphibalanus amphitrite TaxID=1232801 RepID=A0A6A4WZG9_AMPAM|nr:F-box only protein 30 [Amphibalanus amphitrite]
MLLGPLVGPASGTGSAPVGSSAGTGAPLVGPVAAAVLQLLRPARQPLRVLSCGSGPVPPDRLLAALRWPHGLLVTDCGPGPCPAGLPARWLYSEEPGPRLLLLQAAGCLSDTGRAPAGIWSRGQALHLSPDCGRSLGHPLWAGVGRPVCLETIRGELEVVQRGADGLLRRSSVGASRHWLLAEDDLTNLTLTVVYENYSPFFECAQEVGGRCLRPAPLAAAVLLEAMSRQLGFHLRYYRSPDGNWGHPENGTWVGMVGEVVAGRAQLAVGGIFMTPLRKTAADFCRPLTLTYLEIISRPVPLPVRSDFAGLLSPPVWALIGVSLLAVTAVLLAVRLRSAAGRGAGRLQLGYRQLEACYRLLVAQEARAARSAGPLLLAVWLLSSIVHRTAYTSNMISTLSAPPGAWAPESFADLVRHGYRLVTHPGYGAYQAWMDVQNGSVVTALKRRWVQQDHVEAFAHLVGTWERVALLEETPSVMNLIFDAMLASDGAVTEDLVHRGRERHMPAFVAWPAQKHAPYVRRLDELLRRVQPTGLVLRLLQQGEAARRERAERAVRRRCRRLPDTCRRRAVVVLGLEHLSAGFRLLGYGLLAAVGCLLLELLAAANTRRRCRGARAAPADIPVRAPGLPARLALPPLSRRSAMDSPESAGDFHQHCQHCVKLSRCAQAPAVAGQRCDVIVCPAGCGHRLHECKLAEHQLLCPEQRVPCINVEYGCEVTLARRQRAAHLSRCPASVVLCMAEWNRWPLLAAPAAPAPEPGGAPHCRPLDSELLERDQRLLRDSLAPARSLARRLRVFPAVPLRLPGTYDCSHLAPQLQLDQEAAAAERRPLDPPGLERSVCSQLARTTLTPGGDETNSDCAPPPPEPAIDSYVEKMCVHHIGRDMCKLCRHDPPPARQLVRRTWQPDPDPDPDPDPKGGGLRWRRLEITEPVRQRPGKYDLDAALRRNRQLAAEQADEQRRAERAESADGPRLALTIDAVAVPERSRPRALYTFQCARPLRRDEFNEHFGRLHGDVHGGAGGWIQQRCPMAQYGCPHFADRLYPDSPRRRFTVSPVSGCVGVTDVSVRPVTNDTDPETGTETDPGQDPDSERDLDPGSGAARPWRFEELPFEVLQHIASLLDPYSLNHLSLTSRLLRDVCGSLLNSRGLVMLLWAPFQRDGQITWHTVAKSWRFSCAFGPVRRLWLGGGAHVTDHLPRCPFYRPARAAAPFALVPARTAGEEDQELERRVERVRERVRRRL